MSRTAPVAALTEMAGEGLSNFIAAQRVLLQLAQRQNDLLLTGVAERTDGVKPAGAMAELLRRGIDTFIEMQQHFLTMAAKQADVWIDNAKDGKPFDGKGMPEIAREAMETFIRSQKKFLDAVAEETAYATGAKNGKEHGQRQEDGNRRTGAPGDGSLHRRPEEAAGPGGAAGRGQREGHAPHDRDAESVAARSRWRG